MTKKVSVIGCGAWGTALAETLARAGREVVLYARDEGLSDIIRTTRENKKYLPGIPVSPGVAPTSDLAAAAQADIVLLATPAQYLRGLLQSLRPYLRAGAPLVNCAKGIEVSTGKLLGEVAAEILPDHPYAVLSGPNFAHEVARGLPAAATFATHAPKKDARIWAETLRGAMFRPYLSDDPVGAEVAGALKNVIAIACGIVEGKKLGQNARAAVMTRGMAEIRRLGVHKGGKIETFLGLSGIGDLNLTCNSMSSRNFSLGAELGQGARLSDILAARHSVAEGVATARAATEYARAHNIDMPVTESVDAILHGEQSVDAVVTGLLSRALRDESE